MDKRSEEQKRQDDYLKWLFNHPSLLSRTDIPEYLVDGDKWFLTEEDRDRYQKTKTSNN